MAGWSTQLQTHYYSSPSAYHPICLQGAAKNYPMEHNSYGVRAGSILQEFLHHEFDSFFDFSRKKKKQTFYHVHLSLLLKALSLKMLPLCSTHNTRFSKVGPVRCRMPFFSYWERADPPVVTPLGFPPSMGGKESFRLQEALEELKPQAQCQTKTSTSTSSPQTLPPSLPWRPFHRGLQRGCESRAEELQDEYLMVCVHGHAFKMYISQLDLKTGKAKM